MKKYLFTLLLSLGAIWTYGQETWHCPEFDHDLLVYNDISKEYKNSGNKKWSQKLLEAFPVASDNTIKYQYVVNSDSSYNVQDISTSLLSWYKIKMTNVNPNPTGDPEHLSGIAVLQHIGKAFGYMTATYISAREEVTIDIKENKVRITVTILSYIGANTWSGVENIAPGSCYPADPKGSQKDSHAMAFINCHYDAINTVASIIKHLNESTKVLKEGEDEW